MKLIGASIFLLSASLVFADGNPKTNTPNDNQSAQCGFLTRCLAVVSGRYFVATHAQNAQQCFAITSSCANDRTITATFSNDATLQPCEATIIKC